MILFTEKEIKNKVGEIAYKILKNKPEQDPKPSTLDPKP